MSGFEVPLLIAATVAGTTGAVMQAQPAKAQGKAQEKIAKYNAAQAERQARIAKEQAKTKAQQFARQSRIVQAANIAKASKSGISIAESPSTLDVLADTAYQFGLDRNAILTQGLIDYQNYQSQASLLRAEGAFAKAQGNQAFTWGMIDAGGTLAGGLAKAGMYSKMNKPPTKWGSDASTGGGLYGDTGGGGPTGGGSRSMIDI